MFNIFNKKPQGEQVIFKIDGMHCTSCSMNIDGELEDAPGVNSAETSYAQATTKVDYDPAQVTPADLKKIIEGLEYQATQI